jgi:formylglycine-generating enzyme required for sulfatase activity
MVIAMRRENIIRSAWSIALLGVGLISACGGTNRTPADADADTDVDADAAVDGDEDGVADADGDGEPLPEACPEEMIEVPDLRYCIDPFEASIGADGAARSMSGELPATDVNWNRADAACRAAGKVLCPEEVWLAACTAGGTRTRPYGDMYDPAACNGGDDDFDLLPAGSLEGCEGGLDGLFDMVGNVFEWVGPCVVDGPNVTCTSMGCEWDCRGDNMLCETSMTQPPQVQFQGSGFRCCLQLADR